MHGAFVVYVSLSGAMNFVILKCEIIWHMLVSVYLLITVKIRSLCFIIVVFVDNIVSF